MSLFDAQKKRISKFSEFEKFYEKRENPSEDQVKKIGLFNMMNKISELYHTNIPVKAYIKYPHGKIVEKKEIDIQIMDKDFKFNIFSNSPPTYSGELPYPPSDYNFHKYITIKKYNDDDILIFPSRIFGIFGGKTKRLKRKKLKQKKSKKTLKNKRN